MFTCVSVCVRERRQLGRWGGRDSLGSPLSLPRPRLPPHTEPPPSWLSQELSFLCWEGFVGGSLWFQKESWLQGGPGTGHRVAEPLVGAAPLGSQTPSLPAPPTPTALGGPAEGPESGFGSHGWGRGPSLALQLTLRASTSLID